MMDQQSHTPSVTPANRMSFWRSLKMVAWSFAGVRSRAGYQEDLAKVNPLHVMLVGFICVVLILVGLMLLANWVVAK